MKKILITGGTGFIGANLARALVSQDRTVKIFKRINSSHPFLNDAQIEYAIGDVRDANAVRAAVAGCDTVFHTAAVVSFWKARRKEQYDTNIGGTANVVDACIAEGVSRLVHTSSITSIGYVEEGTLADETSAFNWERFDIGYKNSKQGGEEEIRKGIARGLDAVIVNPAVVIGPGDIHFNGGSIIKTVKRGLPFYIKGGTNIVYVDDVVNGHIAAALRGKTGERYILGGENLTHRQSFDIAAKTAGGIVPFIPVPIRLVKTAAKLFDLYGKIFNREPLITSELAASAGRCHWFSSQKAIRELGYTITPFREAVEKTYKWYVESGLLKKQRGDESSS